MSNFKLGRLPADPTIPKLKKPWFYKDVQAAAQKWLRNRT